MTRQIKLFGVDIRVDERTEVPFKYLGQRVPIGAAPSVYTTFRHVFESPHVGDLVERWSYEPDFPLLLYLDSGSGVLMHTYIRIISPEEGSVHNQDLLELSVEAYVPIHRERESGSLRGEWNLLYSHRGNTYFMTELIEAGRTLTFYNELE